MKKIFLRCLFVLCTAGRLAHAATTPPVLSAPTASATVASPITVTYTLPDTPRSGSVELIFTGTQTITIGMNETQSVTIALDTTNVVASSGIITSSSSSTIPAGTYAVSIRYENNVSGGVVTTTATGVTILAATPTPTLSLGSTSMSRLDGIPITYTIPTTPLADTVRAVVANDSDTTTITLPNTAGANLTATLDVADQLDDGTYTVTLSYQDQFSHPAATASVSNLELTTPALATTDVALANDATSAAVSVALTGASTNDITVNYATADGTAVAGTAYTATSGTLTWPSGDTTAQTITVPVTANPSTTARAFTLTLASPVGAVLSTATSTITQAAADATTDTGEDDATDTGTEDTTTESDTDTTAAAASGFCSLIK